MSPESDDEVNNQSHQPYGRTEIERQQSQNEQTKTYTYGDSEQNDKSNHERI